MLDLEFSQCFVELCSDPSIIHLPRLWWLCLKKHAKWDYRMLCCVNTFQDCLQEEFVFQCQFHFSFHKFQARHLFQICNWFDRNLSSKFKASFTLVGIFILTHRKLPCISKYLSISEDVISKCSSQAKKIYKNPNHNKWYTKKIIQASFNMPNVVLT